MTPFRSSPASSLPRRSSIGSLVQQGTLLLMTCIGGLILLLAFLILFHQNANATKGYRLRTLERERSQLMLEEEVVKMEVAQKQSLEFLQEDTYVAGMIPAKNAQYVSVDGPSEVTLLPSAPLRP